MPTPAKALRTLIPVPILVFAWFMARQFIGDAQPPVRFAQYIPLMLAGHRPRTMRLAVEHADIWSGFATTSSQPQAFVEMVQQLESVCADVGRDPATLGKSIGVVVAPPGKEPIGVLAEYDPIRGSVDQILDAFNRFAEMGCTRLELMTAGDPEEIIEGLAPVVDALATS